MGAFLDLTGQKFGRLTALSRLSGVRRGKGIPARWNLRRLKARWRPEFAVSVPVLKGGFRHAHARYAASAR